MSTVYTIEVFTNAQNWQYCHYFQLCIPIYLLFPNFSVPYYDVGKCEITYLWVSEDYISRLRTSLFLFISNGTAKAKLAILACLYCGKSAKNSNDCESLSQRDIFSPKPSREKKCLFVNPYISVELKREKKNFMIFFSIYLHIIIPLKNSVISFAYIHCTAA